MLNSYRWTQISLCRPERETLRSLTIWISEKWTEVIGLTHFNEPYGNFFCSTFNGQELVQFIFQWLYCYYYRFHITNKSQPSNTLSTAAYKSITPLELELNTDSSLQNTRDLNGCHLFLIFLAMTLADIQFCQPSHIECRQQPTSSAEGLKQRQYCT